MKKTLSLILLVSLVTFSANAQHFGLQAGGLISKTTVESDLFSINSKIKPGFLVGATVDIPLNNTMVINTALNFKAMGTWVKDGGDLQVTRLSYVNLDVVYEYIFDLNGIELFAQGGGYFGVCVLAKQIYKPESGDKVTTDLDIGTDDSDDVKPIDAGLTIGAGVYFGKIRLALSYQHGLPNIAPGDVITSRNRAGVLSFSYFFNR